MLIYSLQILVCLFPYVKIIQSLEIIAMNNFKK